MAHQLWTAKGSKMINITPIVGDITWRSSIEELGQQLSFTVAYNDIKYFPINPVNLGNLILLKNGSEIIRGIILKENRTGRGPISYTCLDYAFYLNKSKKFYNLNKVRADIAIKKIAADFGVPIGKVIVIPTLINEIFPNQTGAEVIKKILERAQADQGIKYRMEMRTGKLYVEKQTDLIVKGQFQLASNQGKYDINKSISGPSRSRSIEEMRNSIQIVKDNKVIAQLTNSNLIKNYGLLQEIVEVQDKDVAKARNVAKNMLADLGRIFEDISLPMLGDDRVRSGRLIEITEPVTGLKGKYLIKSDNHQAKNGIHKMTIDLGG